MLFGQLVKWISVIEGMFCCLVDEAYSKKDEDQHNLSFMASDDKATEAFYFGSHYHGKWKAWPGFFIFDLTTETCSHSWPLL